MVGFHRSTLPPRSHNLRSTLFTYQVMKVVVIGTRGIPNIQGGVETHCEELYPRIVKLGADVTIIRRTCHIPENDNYTEYKGVKLVDVYAPKRKALKPLSTLCLPLSRRSDWVPTLCTFTPLDHRFAALWLGCSA